MDRCTEQLEGLSAFVCAMRFVVFRSAAGTRTGVLRTRGLTACNAKVEKDCWCSLAQKALWPVLLRLHGLAIAGGAEPAPGENELMILSTAA